MRAAGVEAAARVPFDGLGVEYRPDDFHDGARRVVFGGNQVDGVFDAHFLLQDQSGQLGIGSF